MRIRQAEPADTQIIAEFNTRLASETEGLRLEPQTIAAGVRAVLQDPARGLYYVAETDGRVVGQVMITYEWSDWRNGNIWWLQSVYVHPDHRGRGVFRALFKHLETLAAASPGVCGLRLYMHSANQQARQAYLNLGMVQTEYVVFESGQSAGHGG